MTSARIAVILGFDSGAWAGKVATLINNHYDDDDPFRPDIVVGHAQKYGGYFIEISPAEALAQLPLPILGQNHTVTFTPGTPTTGILRVGLKGQNEELHYRVVMETIGDPQ